MSDWRPEQYDPAAHQQRVSQQQTPYSHSDPWYPTRSYEQPQQQPWPPPQQPYGQPPSYPPQQPYGQAGGRRDRRKRNGIVLGVIGGLLIFFAGVAVGAAGNSGSTGKSSPSVTSSPTDSLPGKTAKALPTAKKKKKTPKKTHTAAPSAKAPSTPAHTTHAAAPATSAPPAAPASTAPVTCHPLTNGGNCYEPGEYCRDSDHGVTGVAGDGEAIICEDNDGWRWEPA